MPLKIIGEHPLAVDAYGKMKVRIGTVFLEGEALVTLPGIHAMQRIAYTNLLDEQRSANRQKPLSDQARLALWEDSVDLIMEHGQILIRPDPEHMERAFAADELLQDMVSKRKISFLHATNERVKEAIKERGELWRIAPLPRSAEDRKRMIVDSKVGIGQRAIYYYNKIAGTRYLTCQEFADLGALPHAELAGLLHEIREFSGRTNRMDNPEVAFFMAGSSFGHSNFGDRDFLKAKPSQLAKWYGELKAQFANAVPPEFREDNMNSIDWRNRMFSTLVGQPDETLAEEILQGLSSEFFLQIRWLPGGRVEKGELIWDSVFEECEGGYTCGDPNALCDWRARKFIFNFIRDYTDVEHVNIGRVETSLALGRKKAAGGACRGVYVVEIQRRDAEKARVRIIRMQKWGIAYHLDDGKDLLTAIMLSEDYTEYILDRRLGCRQLGMNLPSWLATRRLSEEYDGPRVDMKGVVIWATYFEREYVSGIATDKVPAAKFENGDYATAFARLLGQTAAVNMIVGRGNTDGTVIFDDGDEVVVVDGHGIPAEIVVSDHTGAFANYRPDFSGVIPAYAEPIASRLPYVTDKSRFSETYTAAFLDRFRHIQSEYRRRRLAFDHLFQHRKPDGQGNFADRWISILRRLERADASDLAESIRRQIGY